MPPRPADGWPAAAFSGDVTLFAHYLEDTGQDYLLLEQADDQRAQLRFCGALLGQTVVWNCEFVTLAAEQADRGQRRAAAAPALRNFIEVGEPGPQGVPLRVGLAVARIDQPAIEKMIIMIRNYKRLQPGRHEYGQAQTVLNHEA
jgi:hypothetical protein